VNDAPRILGVDYGQKRTGLAISDPLGIFGQPIETIEAADPASAAAAIKRTCEARGVSLIVLGLPRNMDNTLGPKAKEALAFRDVLAAATGLEVVTRDERLTTVSAERALRETSLSRKKRQKHVNSVAAQIILQGYLDAKRKSQTS
jgi:putative Holliday junction resolvase